jgi:hypothetical protein
VEALFDLLASLKIIERKKNHLLWLTLIKQNIHTSKLCLAVASLRRRKLFKSISSGFSFPNPITILNVFGKIYAPTDLLLTFSFSNNY